ncbi:hypothetical protein JANAI62_11590 [Jannaschia pagri]|uniref:Uncharacterized protein n=1 Tax=Jannaschia pagri TaxID=2829797 RepID=A0ABQ4NJE5_9RHOB|nr:MULTISPECIES: hypothetical protein [unclassified Jannaschia]GIT90704.1 hypothetical protein JANAI61_11620 [Jannaschia sp. AI_61]GIT94536.1 hypothetical protein JANAI62_11590 [Jannaschia sp. AI_62]
MALDSFAFAQEDAFEFNTAPASIPQAFASALAARGIDMTRLSEAQIQTFSTTGDLINRVLETDLQSAAEAVDLLGEAADISLVDDLRTTDGMKLNGVATKDGKIVLDSALTGDTLRDTVIEELAEAAFYEAFDRDSVGDFGAEIEARIEGKVSEEDLEKLSSVQDGDTVQTEFGEGQASSWGSTPITSEAYLPFAREFQTSNFRHYAGEAKFVPFSITQPGIEIKDDLNTSRFNGRFDLNGDGIKDTYSTLTYTWDTDHPNFDANTGRAERVIGISPSEILPTSQSARVLVGNGSAKTTWVLREDQTTTTSKEFNWNVSLSKSISATAGLEGVLSLGSEIKIEGGIGGATTTTNSFSVGREVRDEYTVAAGAYSPGTLVSYGFHAVTADLTVEENYVMTGRITNAAPGSDGLFEIRFAKVRDVDDHFLGIVRTDFDVANAPNASDLIFG